MNDPWTGARLGSNQDSPLGGSYLAETVQELGKWTSPGFATAADRDTAFNAWVANGGVDVNGLRCSVAGVPLIRKGGSWHGVTPGLYSTTAVADGNLHISSTTMLSLPILDQGFPYRLDCDGQIGLSEVGVGVAVAPYIQVDGSTINPVGVGLTNNGGASFYGVIGTAGAVSGILTGAHTVGLLVFKTGDTGNGFKADITGSLYTSLTARVVPV